MSVVNQNVGVTLNFRCPVEGCPVKKTEGWHLVCPGHWEKVPQALRDKVWQLFKTSNGSLEHRMTCAAVIAELEAQEGRRARR
jgi:hypothetical protein